MNWSRTGYVILLGLFVIPSLSHAQVSFELKPGERVRFKTEGALKYQSARVISTSEDSVTLLVGGRQESLSLSAVTTMQRSVGTKTHALGGLLIGTAIGVGVGLVAASATDYSREPEHIFDFGAVISNDIEEDDDVLYGVVGGCIGAVVGLITGSIIQTDDWVSVPQPWTVGFLAHESGGSVALTIPLSP